MTKSNTLIYNDNIIIQKDLDFKYRTNGFDNLGKYKKYEKMEKNDLSLNQKNAKRIMSTSKIEFRKKLKNLRKNNTNNLKNFSSNESYTKFDSNRPMSTLIKSNSVMPLSSGAKDLMCPNAIWRIKKISDLIPKTNFNGPSILNNFKQKRKEIIYKRQNSLPYDLAFLSNRLIYDNDYFVY